MAATTFEVHVSIDDGRLLDTRILPLERREILASFEASLDHWIAERRLELRNAD